MSPKKIDLSGVPRVDPEPLRQKLKVLRNARADIAGTKKRYEALKAEVATLIETSDPDDEKCINVIAAKRVKLEIMPGVITRVERQLEMEMAPALLSEADRFRNDLKRFYADAHAAIASAVAGFIGAYFSGEIDRGFGKLHRAAAFAVECDDCRLLAQRRVETEGIRLPDQPRSNNPDRYDADLMAAVDALLVLATSN